MHFPHTHTHARSSAHNEAQVWSSWCISLPLTFRLQPVSSLPLHTPLTECQLAVLSEGVIAPFGHRVECAYESKSSFLFMYFQIFFFIYVLFNGHWSSSDSHPNVLSGLSTRGRHTRHCPTVRLECHPPLTKSVLLKLATSWGPDLSWSTRVVVSWYFLKIKSNTNKIEVQCKVQLRFVGLSMHSTQCINRNSRKISACKIFRFPSFLSRMVAIFFLWLLVKIISWTCV